jgi:hypothetical protein
MPAIPSNRRLVALALLPLAACASAASTPAPAPPPAAAPVTTLLVRLGTDTVGLEQYTRSASRMEGVLVNRSPFTTISRYTIDLGPNSVPTSVEYSLRRGDGSTVQGTFPSLSMRFVGDSIQLVGHRASGDTARVNVARGELQPYLNGSYGLFELALARLTATGRDSAVFALVPMAFSVRNTIPLPMKLTAPGKARIDWFGYPVYGEYDGRGSLMSLDGQQSTVKVRVDRVPNTDLEALGRSWSARDQIAGPVGPASPRDTVKATVGRANLLIDYSRPSRRGRDVWTNGVLGDSIWRTGANAATQLRSDTDLLIGGQVVPAGTYTLWTQANRDGYHLIVNKQVGQWGTEYHPDRDLIRVPLRETTSATSAEKFTIGIDPQGSGGGVLSLAWGTKVLTVPIAVR